MALRSTRRIALVSIAAVMLAALAAVVGGWPQQPIVSFGPLAMDGTQDVWIGPPPATKHMGVSTSTTAGRARVEGKVAGSVVNFGLAPNLYTLILEGTYDTVTVIGKLPNPITQGTCTFRTPATPDDTMDRTIGSGSAALSTTAIVSYAFYNFAPSGPPPEPQTSPRVATLQAAAYPASLTDGASPRVDLDANDTTFCARTGAGFGVTGKGSVSYAVYDLKTLMNPITGTCTCQADGDTDSAYCDGTIDIAVTISAGASNTGNVTVACPGGSPANGTIPPGGSSVFKGTLGTISWTYGGMGSTVTWSVTGN